MVDKNLFLYDLAVVAIMKDEEPYVKEWLDYHLLAGVDHFYIYDNDSKEEFKKILQPWELSLIHFSPAKGDNMNVIMTHLNVSNLNVDIWHLLMRMNLFFRKVTRQ